MKDERIDDIVSMIDRFMQNDGGHMNISVDSNGTIKSDQILMKTMTQTNSLECAAGNMACKAPTLFEGLDIRED